MHRARTRADMTHDTREEENMEFGVIIINHSPAAAVDDFRVVWCVCVCTKWCFVCCTYVLALYIDDSFTSACGASAPAGLARVQIHNQTYTHTHILHHKRRARVHTYPILTLAKPG